MPADNTRKSSRTPRPVDRGPFIQRFRIQLAAEILAVGVIAVIVIAVLQAGSGSSGPAAVATPADPALVQAVTGLPQSAFDTVGSGSVANPLRPIKATALKSGGKPQVVYIGAEYCPYCAAERWAVTVALSRFGTFSGLQTTRSSPSDVYPNTATLSFHGATYTSQYLAFSGVETENSARGALQTPTSDQAALLATYDAPPYLSIKGAIPFLDVGGKYVLQGASYPPDLFSGLDWSAIAAKLADPTTAQAKAVLGAANIFTAAFCQLTGGQRAAVCQAAGTQAGAKTLGIAGG